MNTTALQPDTRADWQVLGDGQLYTNTGYRYPSDVRLSIERQNAQESNPGSSWRMPTTAELQQLHHDAAGPSTGTFWITSSESDDPYYALTFNFETGAVQDACRGDGHQALVIRAR